MERSTEFVLEAQQTMWERFAVLVLFNKKNQKRNL